jgi:hypothetical protein
VRLLTVWLYAKLRPSGHGAPPPVAVFFQVPS